MSRVVATTSTFIGHNGQSVWVAEGDEHDAKADLVKGAPEGLFAPVPEEPPRRGRTAGGGRRA